MPYSISTEGRRQHAKRVAAGLLPAALSLPSMSRESRDRFLAAVDQRGLNDEVDEILKEELAVDSAGARDLADEDPIQADLCRRRAAGWRATRRTLRARRPRRLRELSVTRAIRRGGNAIMAGLPSRVSEYPQLRYMGNKHRLLPWIHAVLSRIEFGSALDAFSGSGCVSYLLKAMGKKVTSNDFLRFAHVLAKGAVENGEHRISPVMLDSLRVKRANQSTFVEDTFSGIFYTPTDLRFLDTAWANVSDLPSEHHRYVALAALIRACLKRQPRAVFTVADPSRYMDGRRDLAMSLEQHFFNSVDVFNSVVFDNGHQNAAICGDVFDLDGSGFDLVYMDPPYVPRADDNCYIKRYHFLEGLASYWRDPRAAILPESKVKKIAKRRTPFSYRDEALDAFERMFEKFSRSTLVLSYSSNGYPDLDVLVKLMKRIKEHVDVHDRPHRYHMGTHKGVATERATAREYLIVGR